MTQKVPATPLPPFANKIFAVSENQSVRMSVVIAVTFFCATACAQARGVTPMPWPDSTEIATLRSAMHVAICADTNVSLQDIPTANFRRIDSLTQYQVLEFLLSRKSYSGPTVLFIAGEHRNYRYVLKISTATGELFALYSGPIAKEVWFSDRLQVKGKHKTNIRRDQVERLEELFLRAYTGRTHSEGHQQTDTH